MIVSTLAFTAFGAVQLVIAARAASDPAALAENNLLAMLPLLLAVLIGRGGGGWMAACVSGAQARADRGLYWLAAQPELRRSVRGNYIISLFLLAFFLPHVFIRTQTVYGFQAGEMISGVFFLFYAAATAVIFAAMHTKAFRALRARLVGP